MQLCKLDLILYVDFWRRDTPNIKNTGDVPIGFDSIID